MAEEGLLSKLTRNMVIFTSGVVIGVVALKFEQEIGRYARKKFGPQANRFLRDRGSGPIITDLPKLKKDSMTNTTAKPIPGVGTPQLPIWNMEDQYDAIGQAQAPVNVWPVIPRDQVLPRDPQYHWCNDAQSYNYEPRSVLTQQYDMVQQGGCNLGATNEHDIGYTNSDLSQLTLDAAKFYFNQNAQIIGITAIRDCLAVCDKPANFHKDMIEFFKSEGAPHLARLLEIDSEVREILRKRCRPSSQDHLIPRNLEEEQHRESVEEKSHDIFMSNSRETVYEQEAADVSFLNDGLQSESKKSRSASQRRATFAAIPENISCIMEDDHERESEQSFTRSEPARADTDPPNEHPTDTGAAASMPVPTINLERKATPNPPEETEDPTPPMKTENQSEKGVERKDKTPPMETEGQSEEEDKVPPTEVKPTRMSAVEDEDDDDKDQAM